MPPLEAFAADLLALLEAPDPCASRDHGAGTAGPRAVPAVVPAGPAEISSNNNGLQKSGPLGPLGPQKTDVAGFADSAAPPATPPAAAVDNRPAVDNFGAVDNSAPTGHCPVCGSPSFWRSPSSPGWRCAWCEPRDRSRAEAFESLTLASGQWRAGTEPPEPTPTTAADLSALHGPTVAGCLLADVLEQADPDDLADFRDLAALAGFARALLADGRIRPLPPAGLQPLHRLALEIGDDMMELRRWLDLSAQGRRIRARIEREAGACDRCLMALRADPAGGLHAVLARALDGASHAEPVPARPAGGRVQDCYGAWRTADQHAAVADYDRHHWHCDRCIRAGRGYGDRCADGERLHERTRGTDR